MFALVLIVLLSITGCGPMSMLLAGGEPKQTGETVSLHGYGLQVHIAARKPHASPLIVYATGDAGWHDKDKDLFRTLTTWGYPVVGISAPEYVGHLGNDGGRPVPGDIARDFAKIVNTSEASLGLPPSTPIVLVGFSRGAGLAVAVGSSAGLGDRLLGILAIALTREEENVRALPTGACPDTDAVPLATYGILPSLGDTRVAVIQSTGDEYVPAREARQLFGPDTSSRRLRAVESGNHSFRGARVPLEKEMKRSFDWIVEPRETHRLAFAGTGASAGPVSPGYGRWR